jgi:hypothetical protein
MEQGQEVAGDTSILVCLGFDKVVFVIAPFFLVWHIPADATADRHEIISGGRIEQREIRGPGPDIEQASVWPGLLAEDAA